MQHYIKTVLYAFVVKSCILWFDGRQFDKYSPFLCPCVQPDNGYLASRNTELLLIRISKNKVMFRWYIFK